MSSPGLLSKMETQFTLTTSKRWSVVAGEVLNFRKHLCTCLKDFGIQHHEFRAQCDRLCLEFRDKIGQIGVAWEAGEELFVLAVIAAPDSEDALGLAQLLAGISSSQSDMKESSLYLFQLIGNELQHPQAASLLKCSCVFITRELEKYVGSIWGVTLQECVDSLDSTLNGVLLWLVPALPLLLRHSERYYLLDVELIWSMIKFYFKKDFNGTERQCRALSRFLSDILEMLLTPILSREFSLKAIENIMKFCLYFLDPDDNFRQLIDSWIQRRNMLRSRLKSFRRMQQRRTCGLLGHQRRTALLVMIRKKEAVAWRVESEAIALRVKRVLKFLKGDIMMAIRLLMCFLELRCSNVVDVQLLYVANLVDSLSALNQVKTQQQFVRMLPFLDSVLRGEPIPGMTARKMKKQFYAAAETMHYATRRRLQTGKCYYKDSCGVSCSACHAKGIGTTAMQKCSACGVVRYCCRTCQKDHWIAHKELCPLLKKCVENDDALWSQYSVERLFRASPWPPPAAFASKELELQGRRNRCEQKPTAKEPRPFNGPQIHKFLSGDIES
eukprot:TRINITY_DN56360_c0_g1_i1.p1 TRINITY_DN56360_c0_g1~~TRINITY_DN56360_c0_g1_i1.p1  ORF type:complete len:555 (-),score=64.99 TRINITY_DN56360_c0_g1_i1:87-1751(-)